MALIQTKNDLIVVYALPGNLNDSNLGQSAGKSAQTKYFICSFYVIKI